MSRAERRALQRGLQHARVDAVGITCPHCGVRLEAPTMPEAIKVMQAHGRELHPEPEAPSVFLAVNPAIDDDPGFGGGRRA